MNMLSFLYVEVSFIGALSLQSILLMYICIYK